MLVKLSDASWLVSRHERVVRRRLLLPEDAPGHLPAVKDGAVWLIDTNNLAKLWTLDQTRLLELEERHRKSPAVMSAQIATLQAQVRALESRLRLLEARSSSVGYTYPSESHQTRQDAILTEQANTDTSPYQPATYKPSVALPGASPVSFTMRHRPQGSAVFRTRADGGRFLATHGIVEHTVQGWKRDMDDRELPLEPEAYLRYAIERKQRMVERGEAWRVPWQLHQCADPLCVCHELLLGAGDLEVSAE